MKEEDSGLYSEEGKLVPVPSASFTTKIGTALYVAPETANGGTYSQKVDIFSTGVVLFEIFYRPLPLGKERIKVLTDLGEDASPLPI